LQAVDWPILITAVEFVWRRGSGCVCVFTTPLYGASFVKRVSSFSIFLYTTFFSLTRAASILSPRPLDLLDLIPDEPQPRHVATHFGKRVGWQGHPLRCPHFGEELW
jgi:hypothetical protein